MSMLRACEFEVFGRVQGVFFRKQLRKRAWRCGLGIRDSRGTVCGAVEGKEEAVDLFKKWLSTTGSPKSRIDRCQFKSEKPIANTSFTDFSIRR
ncbi:hypothetical protein AHF37_01670 [Paragonimus kellicotti]|nr:hypothetical protein AHF37_01670 [Paragonimus kellicotti]